MYKIISNWYGQLSSRNDLDAAITLANTYKINHPAEEFTVWINGKKVYTTK